MYKHRLTLLAACPATEISNLLKSATAWRCITLHRLKLPNYSKTGLPNYKHPLVTTSHQQLREASSTKRIHETSWSTKTIFTPCPPPPCKTVSSKKPEFTKRALCHGRLNRRTQSASAAPGNSLQKRERRGLSRGTPYLYHYGHAHGRVDTPLAQTGARFALLIRALSNGDDHGGGADETAGAAGTHRVPY